MGKSTQRLDIPAKVDGSANFAMDIELPNMLFATVHRAPVFGAKLQSLDDTVARRMPGVVDIIQLPSHYFEDDQEAQNGDTVAVVAEGFWQAKQAMAKLRIQWSSTGNESVSSASIFRQFSRDLDTNTDRETDRDQGDVATALASARQIVEAEYRVPFLAHACMEPLNAIARVQDGRCDLWIGCQNPLGFKTSVAEALQLETEKVTVHNQIMGGGFGRKAINDWGIQAALIAAKLDRPVRLSGHVRKILVKIFIGQPPRAVFVPRWITKGNYSLGKIPTSIKWNPPQRRLFPMQRCRSRYWLC